MRAVLTIVAAALLAGCSWITTFVVVNATDAPVHVVYRLLAVEGSKLPPCPDDYFVMKPRSKPRALIEELASGRQDAPVVEYTCDSATRTVALQLAPDQAVALFTINNYTGYRTEEDIKRYTFIAYALENLRLRGKSGEIQFAGTQVTRDFTKENNALYVLTYR